MRHPGSQPPLDIGQSVPVSMGGERATADDAVSPKIPRVAQIRYALIIVGTGLLIGGIAALVTRNLRAAITPLAMALGYALWDVYRFNRRPPSSR